MFEIPLKIIFPEKLEKCVGKISPFKLKVEVELVGVGWTLELMMSNFCATLRSDERMQDEWRAHVRFLNVEWPVMEGKNVGIILQYQKYFIFLVSNVDDNNIGEHGRLSD